MKRILKIRVETDAQVGTILTNRLRLSTRAIRALKRTPGGVTLNGEPARVIDRAKAGSELRVELDDGAGSHSVLPVQGPLAIVYEDEDLLVLDKPAGVPVHPSPGHYGDSLANFAAWEFAQRGESFVFRAVNRLDRGTSGLLCAAKNAHAHARLAAQLHTGAFERTYCAVVCGVPSPAAGRIDLPIGRSPGSAIKREVCEGGARAVTHYETLRVGGGYALLRIRLETGRTHQIRVHFAYLGHPLFGDFLYGTERPEMTSGHALHSGEIRLFHPLTHKALSFSSPPPVYFDRLLGGSSRERSTSR